MNIFKSKDNISLYYKDWGIGKPIIFSHGWLLDADMWDNQMFFLARHGYRAIAFDRRGFGRSEQPWDGYNYDTFADDIHSLIEHLQITNIVLVGFSMGGGDVSRYISRYGDSNIERLVLLGSITPILIKTKYNPIGVKPYIFKEIKEKIYRDRAKFIEEFVSLLYSINDKQIVSNGVLKHTTNIALLASIKASIDCVTAFAETNFYSDITQINIPTLIIHGTKDQIVPFESTSKIANKIITKSMLKLYDNAPHGFTVTHQNQLNHDLLLFLQNDFV